MAAQSSTASGSSARSLVHDFPEKLEGLFRPRRYKVAYGGRGAAKSWSFARALLLIGKEPSILWPGYDDSKGIRILCFRETMKSIEESVHQVLQDQIAHLGLGSFYRTQLKNIVGRNGTEFFFAGVRQSVDNLKSYEAVDIAWGAQSEAMSKRSLNVVIPTIRKDIIIGKKMFSSELWFDFNPEFEDDEIYQMFVVNPPPEELAMIVQINHADNPWFTGTLEIERRALVARDPDEAAHVYDGALRSSVEGAIYKKEIATMETENRLTRVPYDPSHPVSTFWDIGPAHTSIWFAQAFPFEFRVIDYLQGELQGLKHYVKELQERPYAYDMHWLPWDGEAKELGSGLSIKEQMQGVFGLDRVRCGKQLHVNDGIEAARTIFGRCWFDREKTKDGLRGLRCYQYEYDKDLRTYKKNPLHDWASHPADAFRTLALQIKPPAKGKVVLPDPSGGSSGMPSGPGGWMA